MNYMTENFRINTISKSWYNLFNYNIESFINYWTFMNTYEMKYVGTYSFS